ncbi:armadillo-type protein [Mycotypha africana]|uniref:armadillo-type protein n=1 Tax=Mycotypha africana TaxID=64632 RepID=UPI0022FFFA09|nr:armadillo-type protein [Mycotypha africana]KAI8975665.1 armadillo-type protein [Mycotypha africana]
MGKEVRKSAKRRSNPLGNRVTSGVQRGLDEQQPTLQSDQVLPVVQKLSSQDATERAWSAACISNLVLSNTANLKLLLSKGIVAQLIKLLGDDSREVVEESLGTLRNICSIDPAVCHEYFAKGILTPLSAMLPQISHIIDLVLKDASLADEADQDRRTSIWDVAENFIYIIWSLSETSDNYIKAINRLNIIAFLISFLSAADQCPTKVVIAAGQCLTTLTDDNKDIYIEFQNHPDYIQTMLNILDKFDSPEKILVRVLCCAILMNIREIVQLSGSWDDERDAVEELNRKFMPILISSLDFDIQNAANECKVAIDSGNVTRHDESTEITPKPKQPLTQQDIYINNTIERLTTLQLSLELLSNICLQDESDEDGWEDSDENMDEAEADGMADKLTEDNIDEYFNDMEKLGGSSAAVEENALRSSPVINMFTVEVFPRLIQLSTPTVLSFPQNPTLNFGVTPSLALTHQRALECLNNFFLAMNDIPSQFWFKEHVEEAKRTWSWLFSTANTIGSAPESQDRNDLLEIIVGCLWALGRGLGQNIPLEPSHVPMLCAAFTASSIDSMRVKIVGTLGPIATRQGDISTNKDIGVFVMDLLGNLCSQRSQVDVVVEALNVIYDTYSDCAFDYDEPVYVQGNFNNRLKQLLPLFKSMVKSVDRRKNFDLRARCDEALMNLVAFIKYKATERRS